MFHWIPALILLLCQGPTGSEAEFGAIAAKIPTQQAQAGKAGTPRVASLSHAPSSSELAVWAALLVAAQAVASPEGFTVPGPTLAATSNTAPPVGDPLPDQPILAGGRTRDGPGQ